MLSLDYNAYVIHDILCEPSTKSNDLHEKQSARLKKTNDKINKCSNDEAQKKTREEKMV